MTAAVRHQLRRTERVALGVGIIALLVAIVFAFLSPRSLAPAWRLAVFACLAPAIGSLIFILIFRTTSGQWVEGLAPFLLAGARLLPWAWLLIIPLLWVPVAAVPHDMRPQVPQLERDHTVVGGGMDARTAYEHVFSTSSRHFDDGLSLYFSRPFLIGRYVVYAIGFFLFALGANRATRITAPGQMRWFGPVGLIVLVFMLHLLSTDWFILLDPGWYSTDFPLVWISGQAIAGIAVAIAAAAWFGDKDPRERGSSGHVRGLDWGNLLLASVMVWAYVAFVQLLIIWSGNLPAEIAWYRHRSNGDWRWVAVALAVIAFAIPFFLLLSRRTKKHRRGLLAVALFLFGGQLLYTIWMIVPAFPITGAADVGLRIALVATTLALFLNRYLALARSASVALAP